MYSFQIMRIITSFAILLKQDKIVCLFQCLTLGVRTLRCSTLILMTTTKHHNLMQVNKIITYPYSADFHFTHLYKVILQS